MTRIAAVDCGTNSIRLLISEYDGHTYTDVVRTMEIVRLGQGVDATGRLDPAAIDRTRAALHGYVDTMLEEDVQAVRMVATSATRDASNKDDFFTMTAEELGRIQPGAQAEVISGDEEATLSFRGAASDLPDARGRICVIDLGGGSTEFVVGTADGEVQGEISVQMGCVRLTERFMTSDPATEKEKAMARQYVQQQLDAVDQALNFQGLTAIVGCAGTFTTLSALTQGLPTYDPEKIHGSSLLIDDLLSTTANVIETPAHVRKQNPVIHEGRADVLGSGSLIVEEICHMASVMGLDRIEISEKDILDGLIMDLSSHIEGAI
ncbi:Ppx/GppA phosphatase family protein [Corynebacterium renale]|uniref:Exopolyphosphatase/guanosine-5'-triphosphate, 3'-diphosphate pyrophosphatase n=1 Tax=Corynebacterium renale TaxID=1724 RepID=A0A2A9DRP8_9CORY|nr:Ppx/GppA phosphatase family protein [Corynebacterium renale]PFG29036.1 exopolyphosphatase/guanosine-5'-triphosphate,3'-diphosphate pyrophosphatase [Corynebacterium renale]SQI25296.1 exopolyphosphatase [Corynebacterium renale]